MQLLIKGGMVGYALNQTVLLFKWNWTETELSTENGLTMLGRAARDSECMISDCNCVTTNLPPC